MKRTIAGFLAVLMLLCAFPAAIFAADENDTVPASQVWDGTVAESFAGGNGLSVYAPYLIETAEQLAFLAKVFNDSALKANYAGSYFRLEKDIYLNDTTTDPSTWREWTMINSFAGCLDGNGYAIHGMKLDKSYTGTTSGNVGFIGTTSGRTEITDLSFVDAVINVSRDDGSASTEKVDGCVYVGTVIAISAEHPIKISGCYIDVDMNLYGGCPTTNSGGSSIRAGGIIGNTEKNKNSSTKLIIEDCALTGTVDNVKPTGAADIYNIQFGALTFGDWSNASVNEHRNCYSNLIWNGSFDKGSIRKEGFVFSAASGNTGNVYSGLYYATGATALTVPSVGIRENIGQAAVSIQGAAAKTALVGFDFENDWFVYDNNSIALPRAYGLRYAGIPLYSAGLAFSGGEGTMEDPYVISTVEDLLLLSEATASGKLGGADFTTQGKYFVLDQDITYYDKTAAQLSGILDGTIPTFPSIGTKDHPFMGNFNGAGHTVFGLYVNETAVQNEGYGLFGVIQDATVKNLAVTDSCIKTTGAGGYLGGTVGVMQGQSRIHDCYFNGILSSSGTVGGIVGSAAGEVLRCGAVGSAFTAIAGAKNAATVTDCYAKAASDDLTQTATDLAGKFVFAPNGTLIPVNIANYSEIALWSGTTATAFAGGTGTKADPYQIATGEQLAYLGRFGGTKDTYYRLTADIALNGTAQENWQGYPRKQWTPVSFSGHLDGNGKTVSGLYIVRTEGVTINDVYGLFGTVNNGEITNLNLQKAYISLVTPEGNENRVRTTVAGLVGKTTGDSFVLKNCLVDATVLINKNAANEGGHAEAAGLVGYSYATTATVTNCGFTGSLSSPGGHGAEFVAAASQITVDRCWSAAVVKGFRQSNFGVGWYAEGKGTVTNCYAAKEGYLSADGTATTMGVSAGVGALVDFAEMTGGFATTSMPKLFQGQWLVKREGGFPVPYAWLAPASGSEVWDGSVATSYAGGSGDAASPYQIATPAQLALLAQQVNAGTSTSGKYYQLTADIYLNGSAMTEWKDTYAGFVQWTPIGGGTTSQSFKGTLDGNGKAIVGLYIYDLTVRGDGEVYKKGWGLIGTISGATVKNLAIMDSVFYMPSTYYVSLFGFGSATISNCYVETDMTVGGRSGVLQSWAGGKVTNTVVAGKFTTKAYNMRSGAFAEAYNAASSVRYSNCYSTVESDSPNFGFSGNVGGTATVQQFQNCYMVRTAEQGSFVLGSGSSFTDGTLVENHAYLIGNAMNLGSAWITDPTKTPLLAVFQSSPFASQMVLTAKPVKSEDLQMTMLGASIRCSDVAPYYGLRVRTTVEMNAFTEAYGITASDFTSLESFYEAYKDQFYFGTLFLPLEYLGVGEQLTHATQKVLDVPAVKTELDSGKIAFNTVVTDFPQDAQNLPMVARSYVAYRVDPNSSEWTVTYTDGFYRTYLGVAAKAYVSDLESQAFKDKLAQEFTADALLNYGVKVGENSLADYRIVISDTASNDLRKTAYKLQQKLVEKCGSILPIVYDTETANGKEIWLGDSDRTASVTTVATLNTASYGVSGTNLYLTSSHYYALYSAVEDFCLALPAKVQNTFQGKLENVSDVALTWSNDGSADALLAVEHSDWNRTSGTNYTMVWNDEFDDPTLDLEKWSFHANMTTNNVKNLADERAYRMENGNLVMITDILDQAERTYTTNYSVTTHDTMNFTGGYLEMRARVPYYGMGEWPSFWATSGSTVLFHQFYEEGATTPSEDCGYGVEVDFFEVFSSPDTCVPNLHKWFNGDVKANYNGTDSGRIQLSGIDAGASTSGTRGYVFQAEGNKTAAEVAREYHDYGFLWSRNMMAFSVDGEFYFSYSLENSHNDIKNKNGFSFNQVLTKKDTAGSGVADTYTIDMSGYTYDTLALSIILNNQMFSEAYGRANSWGADKMVDSRNDDYLFPMLYTVDYMRLYQTEGDILYLPATYGNGTLMFDSGRENPGQKLVCSYK